LGIRGLSLRGSTCCFCFIFVFLRRILLIGQADLELTILLILLSADITVMHHNAHLLVAFGLVGVVRRL
jgi:hypothetical protein